MRNIKFTALFLLLLISSILVVAQLQTEKKPYL